MLPLRARVDLGPMAMKEYSAFPKAPALLELTIRLFSVISRTFIGGSDLSSEMQSVYSTAADDLEFREKVCKKQNSWLIVWVLWHINLCGLFNANPFLYKQSVLFQAIQFSMRTQFNFQKYLYFKLFSLFKQF